ncbi:MAG: hypothetical protein FJY73_10440 [Candidatus Eisenbacteria bacterium]|nr:hypothetical protein [Candidatus Eisenbacteria bacterium]
MKRPHARSRIRLPLLRLAACILLALHSGAAVAAEEFRLTVTAGGYALEPVSRAEGTFRRVEASFPGRILEPGLPSLPMRTFLVGVPEGARVVAIVESEEHADIPGDPIEPAGLDTLIGSEPISIIHPVLDERTYRSGDWFPETLVSIGAEGRFRHQSVVPIHVRTFRTIPASGLLRVYERIELLVRIEEDPARDGKRSLREPAPDDPFFENLYIQTIVNHESARKHRTRPARAFFPPKRSGGSTEWKIRVREGGLYRIDHEELAAAGFPNAAPAGSIALARRGFSDAELAAGGDPFTERLLPLLVEDKDEDGLFGAGDRLFAYLPGFREDRMKRDNDDRFASEAVYFLSTEGGAPPFETRSGWRGYPGLAPLPSFPDSIRWEEDFYYDFKTIAETLDVYYPANNLTDLQMDIDLPPADTNGMFRIKAMTVSAYYPLHPYHRYVILHEAAGDTVFNEVVYGSRGALFTSGLSFPAALLATGSNRFLYKGSRGSDSTTPITGALGFLDWFEVHAPFLYVARNDYARFSTGRETGRVQMEVAGFDDPEPIVLDLSDPYAPILVEPDSVRFENGAWTIVLQDSVGFPRAYAAATRDGARRLGEGAILRDEPSRLAFEEADYLIVAWDDLLEAVEPLAEHRESQGYRVARVRVSDVYDEFNGGVKDPIALQRFFRYAFERWEIPPTYVLLVGDGYEEQRGIATNGTAGDADLVPSYPMFQRGAPSVGNEWVASDAWYALLDGNGDLAPEMVIGRFPASSAAEADVLVEKTLAYEAERKEEPWRRRVAFVADDAWVKDSAVQPYRNGAQYAFENASFDFAKRISSEGALRADTTTLFLSRDADIYRSLCPYGDPPNPMYADHTCVMTLTRDPNLGFTPRFFDLLNRTGVSLVNFQGHGNRTSLTHELFLVHGRDTAFTGRFHNDLTDFSEAGAPPYIFLAFGCSISEFEVFTSYGYDALGENMILLPGRGGVLTYGSTGLEYLDPNIQLNRFVLARWFPVLGDTRETPGVGFDRTAGEGLTSGMIDYSFASGQTGPVRRFVVLGDPALRIGPPPPTLLVTMEGDTIPDGATRLPAPDGSPWAIEARIAADVHIEEDSIEVLENGEPIDRGLYTIERSVDPATNRWVWTVLVERAPEESLRAIGFRATDRWGTALSHTMRTWAEIAFSFEGAAYVESLLVSQASRLRIDIGADVSLALSDIRAETQSALFDADTLFRTSDSTWAAEIDLLLAEGEQEIVVSIGGLRKALIVRAASSGIRIAASVDGIEVESGHFLLGHLDGTPPAIDARIETWLGFSTDSVRVLAGGVLVPPGEYATSIDTIEGRIVLRIGYEPAIGNETGDIRIEAYAGAVSSLFLLRASLPIALTADGTAVENGDFLAPMSVLRASATYPNDLPLAETAFFLNGVPISPDTLRREGSDGWIAAASVETGGGTHTVAFRAGAFSASREVRVENRLRVVDPLCHPNPSKEGTGFYYHLTLPADEVKVEIYTITGRKIRVLSGLSRRAGYNENFLAWDGRDEDGDRVARGVYPFRVVAARAGEKAEAIGKIVVQDPKN